MKSSCSARRRTRKVGAEALSLTTLICAAGNISAQGADPKPAPEPNKKDDSTTLKDVVVEADSGLFNPSRLQTPKQTQPVRDVPQTITVIPKALIEERGAFSLRDVLRNTPGISKQAGEGVSGSGSGDNLTIRGFASRSDWFIDGVRDMGTYNRDPFNTEQVEVAKGPASTTNGRGSTGGSINLATKMANQKRSNTETVSVGTNDFVRGTFDVNEPLNEHTAIRLNGMYHDGDIPGRDTVHQERYGLAASLAFGLGTDTRFTFNYQRMEENNIPDFGIPWIPTTGTFVGAAAPLNGLRNQPAPVDYSNFYGRPTDFQRDQGDMFTAIFEHDFNDKIKVRNLTRYSRLHYESVITAPRFRDIDVAPGTQYSSLLAREGQRRKMTNEVFSNQTLLTAAFDTGPVKHDLVTGLEFSWERQLLATAVGISSTTDLFNPNANGVPGLPANPARDITGNLVNLPGDAESHLDTISAFVFDTISIGKHLEITAGIRYDHLDADARGTGNGDRFGGPTKGASNSDDIFSWKAAIVYKPVEYGSIYLGYATSVNPTIDGAISGGLGLNNGSNVTTNRLDPEEARSFELGTKWDLFNERLSLTAAVFRTEKTNARTTSAGITTLAGEQEVEGIELGVAGQLTKKWAIFAGFCHMDSSVEASRNVLEVNNPLPNAPDNTFNIWTSYNVLHNFQVGFGAQYVGNVIGNSANAGRIVPDYWTADAMLSYRFSEKLSLRLNIYNITDERYIETSSSTGHFIPGPGRSAALTATIKF